MSYLTGNEPGVKEILHAAYPDFNGKRIECFSAKEVRPGNTYWDEGTRFTYVAVEIATRKAVEGKRFNPVLFGGPAKVNAIPMAKGVLVVEHLSSRNRRSVCIYAHPDDAPELLKSPDSLSANEETVLAYTVRYKSSYGGVRNLRYREANRDIGISPGAWETAKASCIMKKLLTRAGTITVSGRNAEEQSD